MTPGKWQNENTTERSPANLKFMRKRKITQEKGIAAHYLLRSTAETGHGPTSFGAMIANQILNRVKGLRTLIKDPDCNTVEFKGPPQ